MDIHYINQVKYCEANKLPMFASARCSHNYAWVFVKDYGRLQTLGEMLIEKYGEEEAMKIASSTHIISCPICSKSWCD